MAAHTLSWTDLSTIFHARNWWNRFGKCDSSNFFWCVAYTSSIDECVNKNISQFSENFSLTSIWGFVAPFQLTLSIVWFDSPFWMRCCWNLCVLLLTQTSAHYSSWVHIYACAFRKGVKKATTLHKVCIVSSSKNTSHNSLLVYYFFCYCSSCCCFRFVRVLISLTVLTVWFYPAQFFGFGKNSENKATGRFAGREPCTERCSFKFVKWNPFS